MAALALNLDAPPFIPSWALAGAPAAWPAPQPVIYASPFVAPFATAGWADSFPPYPAAYFDPYPQQLGSQHAAPAWLLLEADDYFVGDGDEFAPQ